MGELKNIDIYNMVDIALSSNFENHHILPSVYRQEMIDLSWKSLSKIFSRGVLIEYEKYNYRAIGLSEEGTIELLNRSKLVSVDDLEKIEWKFDMC